jgi:hypothetical protein
MNKKTTSETAFKADYKVLGTKSVAAPNRKPGKRAGRGRKK